MIGMVGRSIIRIMKVEIKNIEDIRVLDKLENIKVFSFRVPCEKRSETSLHDLPLSVEVWSSQLGSG